MCKSSGCVSHCMFCPVIPAAFVFVFNSVNHSLCTWLSLPRQFPIPSLSGVPSLTDLTSPAGCFCLCLSPVLLLIPNSRERWRNIFCSPYWSLGLRFELLLCLIWWNRVHIAQSRFLFEKPFACCCIFLFHFILLFKLYLLVRLVHL